MAPRYLLDTHVLLWALTDPNRLSPGALLAIENGGNALYVSAASAWEIATKFRIGKLPGAESLVLAFPEHLNRLRITELPITSRHALAAGGLSWHHRDPFDRMIAAQSILESLPLVSGDHLFDGLAGLHLVW